MSSTLDILSERTVLVIGDLMVDRYVDGGAHRLSPEAPIPVLTPHKRHAVPGGAANVALGLRALGCKTILIGVVGQDEAANDLDRMLTEAGVRLDAAIDANRPTTTKTRFVSGGHQLLRVDEELATPLAPAVAASVIEAIHRHAANADAIVLSDYAKGVLTPDIVTAAILAAGSKPVIVDPKRRFGIYTGATVLTPNRSELFDATGERDIDRAAAIAMGDCCCPYLVVTRSEEGVSLYRAGVEPLHLAAHTQEVADVSGAGDTLVATLSACLAAGETIEAALVTANVAAGIAVSKRGTSVVRSGELRLALHEQDGGDKLVSLDRADRLVRAWQAQGLRVGFTNGCFDLLHPGHVATLRRSRAMCDRLVVGLNSDRSVGALKGPSRPVQDEVARAAVLSGLEPVNLVVIFDALTPLALIERLTPDVLIKGADYAVDDIVGAGHVRGHGGVVVAVPFEAGHSTTNLVTRMRERTFDHRQVTANSESERAAMAQPGSR